MLWYIKLKFCIWLSFTVLQIKFQCCQFPSIFVGVMPLLQWNPNPVGPSDMTDENLFGPAENISFPDRMSGNVFSDNELKKCPKRFNIKNTISQIVFSCGFIFDSREQTFGTIFLLPYVHDKLYCMKSPMFKTLKWIGFLFATSYMSASKTQTSNFRFNVLSDGVKLFDCEQLVSVGCISNWNTWRGLSQGSLLKRKRTQMSHKRARNMSQRGKGN